MKRFTAPLRDGMELQEYVEVIVEILPFYAQEHNIGYRNDDERQPTITLSPEELTGLIRDALEGWDKG